MADRPYRCDAIARLHPDGWSGIPPQEVNADRLVATQADVSIVRLLALALASGGEPETGDPYPHVVAHGGIGYVHDGHHRWTLHRLRSVGPMLARVVTEAGIVGRVDG